MTQREPAKEEDNPASITDTDTVCALASCLHQSFTAENHDSLGDELTRLLLHLSHHPDRP